MILLKAIYGFDGVSGSSCPESLQTWLRCDKLSLQDHPLASALKIQDSERQKNLRNKSVFTDSTQSYTGLSLVLE